MAGRGARLRHCRSIYQFQMCQVYVTSESHQGGGRNVREVYERGCFSNGESERDAMHVDSDGSSQCLQTPREVRRSAKEMPRS